MIDTKRIFSPILVQDGCSDISALILRYKFVEAT